MHSHFKIFICEKCLYIYVRSSCFTLVVRLDTLARPPPKSVNLDLDFGFDKDDLSPLPPSSAQKNLYGLGLL